MQILELLSIFSNGILSNLFRIIDPMVIVGDVIRAYSY